LRVFTLEKWILSHQKHRAITSWQKVLKYRKLTLPKIDH
jgi:hypothetical protein